MARAPRSRSWQLHTTSLLFVYTAVALAAGRDTRRGDARLCFSELSVGTLLPPCVKEQNASTAFRWFGAQRPNATAASCRLDGRATGGSVLVPTGLCADGKLAVTARAPLSSSSNASPRGGAARSSPTTAVPSWTPAALVPLASLLFGWAEALSPATLTAANVRAFLAAPENWARMFVRTRIDIQVLTELAPEEADGAASAASGDVDVTVFTVPTGAHLRALGDASCDALFTQSRHLLKLLKVLPLQRRSERHFAERLTSFLLAWIDLGRYHALTRLGVLKPQTASSADAFPLQTWFETDPAAALWDAALPPPAFEVQRGGLEDPLCVRVDCRSAAMCAQQLPHVHLVASAAPDVALFILVLAAWLLHAVRPIVVRLPGAQLFVASLCGILVIAIASAYLVVATVRDTRLGKLGIGAVAVAGYAALLNGVLSSIWFWFTHDFQSNPYLQLTFIASSLVSTLLCRWFLGPRLGALMNGSFKIGSVAFLVAAFQRNPEGTIALLGCVLPCLRCLWWAVRRLFTRRPRRSSDATPAAAAATPRRVANAVYDSHPSDADNEESEEPSDEDAGSVSSSVSSSPAAAAARSDTRWGWNDPTDDLPPEAYALGQPEPRAPSAARMEAFRAEGSHHTRAALRKLRSEIRRKPERYLSRLDNAAEVMQFAGVS